MNNSRLADIAYVATFAALIIALGAVSIPVGGLGVPIVLQNMGILLAALILGWKRGTLAVITVLALGLVGVPVLAGWRTTLSALPGPTTGYLVGYILCAIVVGLIAQSAPARRPARILVFILAGIVGTALQYLFGALWLVLRLGMDFWQALWVTNLPYVPGDAVKVVAAALIAVGTLAAVPDLLPSSRSRAA